MTRRRRQLAISVATLAAVAAILACRSNTQASCSVDVDCPQGSFCRGGVCASVTPNDAAVDGAPAACVSPGSSCAIDNDCCTPPCSNFRCGGSSSGTSGKSGSSCADLYSLCSSDADCCTGLTCQSASCR